MNLHFHHLLDIEEAREAAQQQRLAMQSLMEKMVERTTATVPLLVHEQPKPSESLQSFLFRSAEKNALKSAAELQRALLLPKGKALSKKRHEQLSCSLGGELAAVATTVPTALDKNWVQYGSHRLPRHHLALGASRLCPVCIAADNYGKQIWNVAPFAVCEQHGVYLIDHCACNPLAPLNNSRPGYSICRCGKDLRHAATCLAGVAAHSLSVEVSRLFSATNDFAESGTRVSIPSGITLCGLLDLITFLGRLSANPQAMNLSFAQPRVRMALVSQQFDQAADALFDWPNGMFALFSSVGCWTASGRGSDRIYRALRHLTLVAERQLPPDLNKWFLDAIALFLQTPSAWPMNSIRR